MNDLSEDAQSGLAVFESCSSFLREGKLENIKAYSGKYALEGVFSKYGKSNDPKYLSAVKLAYENYSVKVLLRENFTCYQELAQISLGEKIRINKLIVRPGRTKRQPVVNFAVTRNTTITAIPMVPKSPFRSNADTPVMMAKKANPYSVFSQMIARESSISPLLNINFAGVANQNGRVPIEDIVSFKDTVTFVGVVLETEFTSEQGTKKVHVRLRDIETNDTIYVYVSYEEKKVEEMLSSFNTVKITEASRKVTQNMNIFCRIKYFSRKENIKVVKVHKEPCGWEWCPCKFLEELGLGMYKVNYKYFLYGLQFVHTKRFYPVYYLRDISDSMLVRSIIKIKALVRKVLSVTLEYICTYCKKNSRGVDYQCFNCSSEEVSFNIKACVILDDNSGKVAQGRTEITQDVVFLLQLTPRQIENLKVCLETSGLPQCFLSKSNFSPEFQNHLEKTKPLLHNLAVRCFSFSKEDGFNSVRTVFLNSKLRENGFPVTSLKIIKVLQS